MKVDRNVDVDDSDKQSRHAENELDVVTELSELEQASIAHENRRQERRRMSRPRVADWQRGRFDFLLFPIRVAHNFFDHWGFDELLVQNAYRCRRLLRRLTRFEGRDVAQRTDDGELILAYVPTAKTLANPIWWCIWLVQFPWLWIVSRPYLSMVVAAPALLFLGYGVFLLNAGRSVALAPLSAEYRKLFLAAYDEQDFAAARFYGDVLVQNNPRSAADFYNRAVLEEQAGELDACRAYMSHAAEKLGSGQAAWWLAGNLGDRNQLASWPEESLQQYEKWLNIASERDADASTATKALADLYRVRGDLQKAYQEILKLEESDASIAPLLVAMEKELGLEKQARTRAAATVESNLALLRDVPDLVDVRVQTAKLMVYLGKEFDAAKLLIDRSRMPQIAPQEQAALRRPIADSLVLLANIQAEQDSSPRGLMKRLDYIQRAVQYDPTSRPVLDAVMEACLEIAESNDDELAVIREAIVRGISPDAAHFITGTVALLDGNVQEALQHLDIAMEKNPNLPGVLNNLAYAICQQSDPDLDRALRLANAAVRASPGNAYALETRGQILVLLGRWQEAISDLEVALEYDELKSLVRPSLATAYEKLGQPEIAARHRELLSKGL